MAAIGSAAGVHRQLHLAFGTPPLMPTNLIIALGCLTPSSRWLRRRLADIQYDKRRHRPFPRSTRASKGLSGAEWLDGRLQCLSTPKDDLPGNVSTATGGMT